MKKQFRFLVLFFFLIVLEGCSTTININGCIDKNLPIELTVYKRDSVSLSRTFDTFVILVNSYEYEKIIQWGNENTKGWKTAYASYIVVDGIVIRQGEFRLILWNDSDGVVIAFTDKNGKSRQYHNIVKENKLKFVLK
jgi:hypothetical protein